MPSDEPPRRERPLKAVRQPPPGAPPPPPPKRERPLRAERVAQPPTPPARERPLKAERVMSRPTYAEPPSGPPTRPRPQPTQPETPAPPPPDDRVVVSFEGPGRQRRWTVALRVILAIPAMLWLFLVGIAAFFGVVAGWVAALFIGRVPKGLDAFLSRYVQLNTRYYGYTQYLLTDRYPPFSLDSTDYAISVETDPGRLNRAAVLFRLVLVIPASIVYIVVGTGVQAAGVVVWLIVLIMGRLPAPLFEAEAAVLRYQTRFWAYLFSLTAEYPGGLFGDNDAAPREPEGALLPARPRITRLVLSAAGRRLVILFIVLGAVLGVGGVTAAAINTARAVNAFDKLDDRHSELGHAIDRFQSESHACALSGGIDCLHSAEVRLADAFEQFARGVEDISFPAVYTGDVGAVINDARDCADSLRRLTAISDRAAYQTAFDEFQKRAHDFDLDYQRLTVAK